MMRNLCGQQDNNMVIAEVDDITLPVSPFVFIGNPGCFEHTDNDTFAHIITTLLDKNISLEEIGWRVLLYIWLSKNSQKDQIVIQDLQIDPLNCNLSLKEIKIKIEQHYFYFLITIQPNVYSTVTDFARWRGLSMGNFK